VGLVPPPGFQPAAASTSPNPDALAVLLSLSIRDGLFGSSFSVWPWLAGIQVVLLLGLLAGLCSRQLRAASTPPES
jgi:hypothetical protein